MRKMEDEELSENNELTARQADRIIKAFKNIGKTFGDKFRKSAKQYGFTSPQLSVIFHLYKTPGITLNELSEHMMLTKSTVSGIINRLVNQEVVVREVPKNNRRIIKLSLSEEFIKNNNVINMKKNFAYDIIANAVKNLDPKELENIVYSLEKLNSLMQDNNDDK
ncbi:MarR family transcriptional regulator [Clostridium sp. JN-1]|uniref:MarR family winged helix-turn-helix transcriptional regulator n=1 Tax=Clostridium sp. JN-1 TaxID=2483110 RepID=UPI00325AD29B